MIGPASAVLEGGHTSVVRSAWSPSEAMASSPELFCWTGGEDGRLCSWSLGDEDIDKNAGWVSNSLVMKKSHRHKVRSKPY